MSKWTEVGEAGDFPDGEKRCKTAGTMPVVVCKVEGKLQAFQNMCPHAGLPVSDGGLNGKVIVCPYHGFAYDVETGKNVDFEGDVPLRKFDVRESEGKVEIDLESKPN